MSSRPDDPLLGAARTLLILMMATLALAGATCVLAVPALFVFRPQFVARIAQEGLGPEAINGFAAVGVLLLVAVVLAVLFLRNLYRIIGTVGSGDPFVPANADRLARMGWLMVGLQAVAIPGVALIRWIETQARDLHTTASVNFSWILLALTLFILARVFRQGAAMRADLEGTV